MAVKTRGTITTEIAADILTGSAGNITAAKTRTKYGDLNDSKANVIKSVLDCSANPNYPASERGDMIPVSVAGKIGGASGINVNIGDVIVCLADAAAGTHAAVGSSFTIVKQQRDYIKKDEAETDEFQYFKGSTVVLMTGEKDVKTTFDEEITLPTGMRFFPLEVGVICSSVNTPGNHPTVRFGNTGSLASLLAATALTDCNAVGERKRFTTLVTDHSVTTLSFGVTAAATGTSWAMRGYFVGFLVEDE